MDITPKQLFDDSGSSLTVGDPSHPRWTPGSCFYSEVLKEGSSVISQQDQLGEVIQKVTSH